MSVPGCFTSSDADADAPTSSQLLNLARLALRDAEAVWASTAAAPSACALIVSACQRALDASGAEDKALPVRAAAAACAVASAKGGMARGGGALPALRMASRALSAWSAQQATVASQANKKAAAGKRNPQPKRRRKRRATKEDSSSSASSSSSSDDDDVP